MANPIQVNMSRGEISPFLHARIDLDHYRAGMSVLRNWVPMRFGGVTRFPGSVFFGETKYPDRFSRWIPFEFRRDQTYAIEVGHQYFRFWNIGGQVQSPPGTPYEISHPYLEADLPFMQFRQSGDVIYIACDGYAPRKLTRVTETNWNQTLMTFIDGPFMATNATAVTATPSVVGPGAVDWTFSAVSAINDGNGFTAGDIGRHFRFLASDGVWRWGKITAIISTVKVTTTMFNTALPNLNARTTWKLGSWSAYSGYPVAVGIFEDRLGWGGTVLEPLTVWYSVSSGYDTYTVSNPLVDDDAITAKMTGGKLNAVQWLSDGRDAVIGTEGTLRALGRNDLSGALSPSNIRQRTESAIPTSYLFALLIENVLLVTDIYRTKVFETAFSQDVEGYLARELTALNEHLLAQGVRDWAYQSSPHKVIWMVTDEGSLLAGVYDRDQEVFGVSECTLGGDAFVEAICVLPGTNADGDEVWLTVRRTIDGNVVRYQEVLSAFFREGYSVQDYPIYAHSAGVYQGVETNTISGIDHLEGETVGIWADGVDAGNAVVTGGTITWAPALSATLVVFGIRYLSDARTLRISVDDTNSPMIGRQVGVKEIIVDMYQSYGLEIGTLSGVDVLRVDDEAEEDPYDPATLRTGAHRIGVDDSADNAGTCVIQTDSMHPATIRAITAMVVVEDPT